VGLHYEDNTPVENFSDLSKHFAYIFEFVVCLVKELSKGSSISANKVLLNTATRIKCFFFLLFFFGFAFKIAQYASYEASTVKYVYLGYIRQVFSTEWAVVHYVPQLFTVVTCVSYVLGNLLNNRESVCQL
jgi:hypothetical protein